MGNLGLATWVMGGINKKARAHHPGFLDFDGGIGWRVDKDCLYLNERFGTDRGFRYIYSISTLLDHK